MSRYFIILLILFAVASCVPAGKLSEAIDANAILYSKYDSIHNLLNDTIANYTNSVHVLKSNLSTLNDSIVYYRSIANKAPILSEGDIFLNQIECLSLTDKLEYMGLNFSKNNNGAWLASFKQEIKKYNGTDAEVKFNKGFVSVDISDKILFNSGSYTLTSKSKQVLRIIAKLLQAQPDLNFMIEGHTDSKAFKGKTKNDNWALSVNRAAAVARIFQNKYKINPKRIIAAGRSQYVPLDDNKTKAGRSNNRRIRIVLLPSLTQLL